MVLWLVHYDFDFQQCIMLHIALTYTVVCTYVYGSVFVCVV